MDLQYVYSKKVHYSLAALSSKVLQVAPHTSPISPLYLCTAGCYAVIRPQPKAETLPVRRTGPEMPQNRSGHLHPQQYMASRYVFQTFIFKFEKLKNGEAKGANVPHPPRCPRCANPAQARTLQHCPIYRNQFYDIASITTPFVSIFLNFNFKSSYLP